MLMTAAIRRLPSRPFRGRSHQLAQNAPAAAPIVLAAYNHPIVDAALVIRCVMARARSGSDTPMKKVGQRRLMKESRSSAPGRGRAERRVDTEIRRRKRRSQAEPTYGQLGGDKQHQAHRARHAIGNLPADQAAATRPVMNAATTSVAD